MAASTTSTAANALKRVYSDEVMDYFQMKNAEWIQKLQHETKLIKNPIGAGYYWEMPLQSAQNMGTPGEGSAVPTPKTGTFVQGSVTMGQFVGDIEISFLLEEVGREGGAWKNALKREMTTCLDDLTKHVNRIYAGTHGTGRIGQINANTSGVATFVGKLPYGTLLMRPNMLVSVYTADSSGSVRDSLDGIRISKIVPTTRTVTLASGTYTLTANDHIYIAGSYGQATVPNGLAGLVDDGTNLTTVHGQSRSTYEELKAVVLANSGTVRNLTEDLIIQACFDVYQRSGAHIDTLAMNSGMVYEYLQMTRPDRRYSQTGKGVPSYDTGYKDKPSFNYAGVEMPIEMMSDIAPRTIYGLTMSKLCRLGDERPHWYDFGGGQIFQQGISSSVYTTSKVATLIQFSQLAAKQLNCHFRIDDLSDLQLCGASVGGSDT